MTRCFVFVDQAFSCLTVHQWLHYQNAVCAASLSPAAIAASTFLMKVRTIERRLALCLRRFSDCTARFLADLILAKVQLPNIFY